MIRLAGRWLALAVAIALGLSPQLAVWFPSLSPCIALGGALAAKSATAMVLAGLPVLVFTLVWPRWFCRHACPMGLLLDLFSRRGDGAAWRRWPPIGKWLLVITLGGAAFGYPVFLWLDPLALFAGFLNGWHTPVSVVAGMILPVILVFNFFLPKVWCRRICPLGAMQELLALARRQRRAPLPRAHAHRLARRAFIGGCAGAAGAVLLRRTVVRGGESRRLRPPGALPEDEFTGVCVRCGNCGRVCPSRVIRQDLRSATGWLAPVMRFEENYCREDCCRCGQVCPSGAIARLALPEKRARVIGAAAVNLDACLMAQGQECTRCIHACPVEAISAREDNGGASSPEIDAAKCNGCGACEAACPAWPTVAVRVAPSGVGKLSA